jgi:hypothetical protein
MPISTAEDTEILLGEVAKGVHVERHRLLLFKLLLLLQSREQAAIVEGRRRWPAGDWHAFSATFPPSTQLVT